MAEAIRSVGVKAAYSTGSVSVDETGLIVTLEGGSFAGWEQGDAIVIDSEACFIQSVDSNLQVTLQSASVKAGLSELSFVLGVPYSNWAGCAAAVGGFADSVKFIQVSEVTDNVAFTFNKALEGKKITLASNKDHNGNFNGGWLTTFSMNLGSNAAAMLVVNTSTVVGASFVMDKLNIIHTGTTSTIGRVIQINTATTNIVTSISNILVNLNSRRLHGVLVINGSSILELFNGIAVNGECGIGEYCTGFSSTAIHATSIFENCTVYNMVASGTGRANGYLNYGNVAFTMKNCVSFGNSVSYAYGSGFTAGFGATINIKCASSDSIGSEESLKNLVPSDNFLSLTISDGDLFLKLKSTSILVDGGVAPSIVLNNKGIRGTVRPHDTDKFSIGADEFKSTRPSVLLEEVPLTHNGISPFTFKVRFSESVLGFISSAIEVENGEVTAFVGNGVLYTVTVTPTELLDIAVSVPENVAVDLYGNGNTASEESVIDYRASSVSSTPILPHLGKGFWSDQFIGV